MIFYKKVFVGSIILLSIILTFFLTNIMTTQQAQTLALVLVILSLWATSLVPNYLSSLIFIACLLIFKIAPPATVFSGFSSAAIWLIFSGFIIAAALKECGLSERISPLFDRYSGKSYFALISAMILLPMALAFIMPSALGRVILMMPIAMALAERVGFTKGTNGRTAMALAVTLACQLPGFAILPANIPNVVLSGAAQTLYGFDLKYAQYLLLHYPILGVIRCAIIVTLIIFFFPDSATVKPIRCAVEATKTTPKSQNKQIHIAIILALTLLLWMTDSWHGINPAWIGIVCAIVLLLPSLNLLSPEVFQKSVNFGLFLFVAGILALSAVINETGLGRVFARYLIEILPLKAGQDFSNFFSLCFMSFLTGIITTLPGVPAVLSPMAKELANLTGFSVPAVLMTQVVGFSTVLLPVQSAPLIVGMQLSGEPVNKLFKITLPLTIITLLLLIPLDYFWWKLLGRI